MSFSQMSVIPLDTIIAIPAYRAEKELINFLPHLLEYVSASQIVVLIDGNYDGTESLCKNLSIRTIIHPENQGKGAALTTLFSALSSTTQWIITMDADGQHVPEDLTTFIDAIQTVDDYCAIVAGSRVRKGTAMPLIRRFSNSLTSRFISLVIKQSVEDSQCGYRAYRSSFVSGIECKYHRFEMETEILIRAKSLGFSVVNVPVATLYTGGPSHISHVKDTVRWIVAVFVTVLRVRVKPKGKL